LPADLVAGDGGTGGPTESAAAVGSWGLPPPESVGDGKRASAFTSTLPDATTLVRAQAEARRVVMEWREEAEASGCPEGVGMWSRRQRPQLTV
jgi:hypothetical protein